MGTETRTRAKRVFRVGLGVDVAALTVPDALCVDCHRPVVSAARRVWCGRCVAWVCWFTVDGVSDEVAT